MGGYPAATLPLEQGFPSDIHFLAASPVSSLDSRKVPPAGGCGPPKFPQGPQRAPRGSPLVGLAFGLTHIRTTLGGVTGAVFHLLKLRPLCVHLPGQRHIALSQHNLTPSIFFQSMMSLVFEVATS